MILSRSTEGLWNVVSEVGCVVGGHQCGTLYQRFRASSGVTNVEVRWRVVIDSQGTNVYEYLFRLSHLYSIVVYAMIGRAPVKR
jgi:hypothetical protein